MNISVELLTGLSKRVPLIISNIIFYPGYHMIPRDDINYYYYNQFMLNGFV